MDLESRGIPGGYILSEAFRTDEEMADIAEKAFADVLAMVVVGSSAGA